MTPALFDRRSRLSSVSRALLILLPLLFVGVCMDNDFWFVINHGRYLLAHGFTDIEPFTVHEGLAFSFEKWLTCILFYKIYDWFGTWGMYVFMLLVFALIQWLFYKNCLLFSYGNENVSLILCMVVGCTFAASYIRTRPQIFSYIFMLGEVYCLEMYARTGNVKKLWPLPLLAFLYMQFHSTMLPMFFIFMLPWLCDFGWVNCLGIKGSRYSKLPILAFMVISAAVTLINPYGVRSFVYLINSLNNGGLLLNINEVKRSSFNDMMNCALPVMVIQAIYIIYRIFRWEKFRLRYFFMLMGTLAMALYAVRNIAFYTLLGGVICAWELRNFDLNWRILEPLKKAGAIAVIAAAIWTWTQPYNIMRATYAWRVLDEFSELHPDTNVTMYTDFNCGSYAEWKGFRCYADPRAEVFLKSVNGKEDILAEVWDTMHARMTARELEEKYHFDYWLVQKNYSLDNQIKYFSDYELICEQDDYRIYKYLPNNK